MATSDIYGTLGAIAGEWAEAMAAASDGDAVDFAFRYLLMLDSMRHTMEGTEQLARSIIAEHCGEEGLRTQYGTATQTRAYERVKWDTDRLEQLVVHPVYGAVLSAARSLVPVEPTVRIKLGAPSTRKAVSK